MIVGFDCSSKTIHAVLLNNDGDIEEMATWISKMKDMDSRLFDLQERLMDDGQFVKVTDDSKAVGIVENPIYIQNANATIQISQVVSLVKTELNRNKMFTFGVDVGTWKKTVLGRGNVSKETIERFALARWGDVFGLSQDLMDAACIAAYGVEKRLFQGSKE